MSPRSILRRIGRTLRSKGMLLTLLMLILAIMVWLAFPLVGLGEQRLAMLLVLAILWGIGGYLLRLRRSKEENALLAALRKQKMEAEAAADQVQASLDLEFLRYRDGAQDAMLFLRRDHRDWFASSRYRLPWYLVLGADDAGKTSLLRDSGLAPAIAGDDDGNPLAETPAANFHIAEDAVFIEIAGRSLTQQEKSSQALWARIFDHLRRLRPRQPINGLLVVAALDRLLAISPEVISDEAAALRRRVDDVLARLRSHAPVYVAVTKLDMLVGFDEFFETLSVEERAAPFGFAITDLEQKANSSNGDIFDRRFANLVEGLAHQQFFRLGEEPDESRHRRLIEFPSQFALLQTGLAAFVRGLSNGQRFGPALNLRGVFFTSTRQNGGASDMLVGSLAAQFGQPRTALSASGDGAANRRHGFFVRGLFHNVLLPEAHLSGLTRSAQTLLQGRDIAVNAALFIASFILLALVWFSFTDGRTYASRITETVAAARAQIGAAVPDGKMPLHFEPVLATLDELRTLVVAQPGGPTFGLYGTGSVEEASGGAYQKAVATMLFPFVWNYLKDGLADPRTPASLRFQQLKLYLMLTGPRQVSGETAAMLGSDFANRWLINDRSADVDRRVGEHLAALGNAPLAVPAANDALVETARGMIADYTLARLGYDMALSLPQARDLPPWRPVDHMGLSGPNALGRASGTSLWDGINGVYTKAGLKDVMERAASSVAETISNDIWVMGTGNKHILDQETARVRSGILDLYRVDFIRQWDNLLADLGMAGVSTPDEVARAVTTITGTPSPVRELLTAIAVETDLDPASTIVAEVSNAAATMGFEQVNITTLSPRRVVNVAKAISDHFRVFRQSVTAEDGKQAPIDAVIADLEPLYAKLNHVATGGDVLELGAEPQTLLNAVTEKIRSMPPVLQPFLTRITDRVSAILTGTSRERLAQIWATTVLPACHAATEGRYPFDPESEADASLEDFAKVFAPQGAIATFLNTYLKPYVDTSATPWRWRKGQQGLGYDDTVLATLETANRVTTVFFGDGDSPKLQFTVKPALLDANARALQFDAGGQTLVYAHGPAEETPYQWPPEKVASPVALSVTPELEGRRNSVSREGAWALFRLFDLGRIQEKQPADLVSMRFDVGGRKMVLQLKAPVTRNPFARDELAEFRCPQL